MHFSLCSHAWNYGDSVYRVVLLCVFVAIAWGYSPTLCCTVSLMCVDVGLVDEVR